MHDAGGFKVFTEPRLYMSIVVLYLFTTIFAMLFDVCALLYNPFGPRDFDIKVSTKGRPRLYLGAYEVFLTLFFVCVIAQCCWQGDQATWTIPFE